VKKLKMAIPGLVLLSICSAGCGGRGSEPSLSQSQKKAKDELESWQRIAAQTAQTYKGMDNSALLGKLVEQSTARKEPFNSLAYRELEVRNNVDTQSLVSLVRENKSGKALLPLLLLRKLNKKAYLDIPAGERAAVLTDALQDSKMFNTWGLPGVYLDDGSQAMLESGQSAYPALRRMLSDTRPAPVFGGQEFMVYERYKFRVGDYALSFLEKMQGHADFRMPVSPADRDSLIKEILK
jgi:hypothetical protein